MQKKGPLMVRGWVQVAAPSSAPSSTQNVSTRYVDVSSCDVGGLLALLGNN